MADTLDASPPALQRTLPVDGASREGAQGPSEDAWIGRILAGRYALERVIGRGGMGFVFEAKHLAVGRQVAVKILRPDMARNAEAVTRFHREARAAASIGHPRIVEVFDFGHTDDGAYLVMELLQGDDLAALIRAKGPLPVARAVALTRQIADGLRAAHARGIVHRDLKNGNVFVTQREGRDAIKILDFGVSKAFALDDDGPSTHQGTLVGTPHTMAPEQGLDGRSVDHRADLYALGCMLFEMLTGELPFTGQTAVEVLYKHVHEAPRRPSSLRTDAVIPHALDDLVMRLLAKDRERRPRDAQAVLDVLDALDLNRRGIRRRWAALAVATVALGAVAAVRLRAAPTPAAPPVFVPKPDVQAEPDARPAVLAAPDVSAVPADAPARERTLTVVVSPVTAAVWVDGVRVPSPDGVVVLRRAEGSDVRVRAVAPGHAAREESRTLDDDATLRWSLVPAPVARTGVVPRAVRDETRDAGSGMEAVPARGDPDGLKASPYRHVTRGP